MFKNKILIVCLTIGFASYLFVETLYNFILYINAYIFINSGTWSRILPWLVIYLAVFLGELIFFSLKKISNNRKWQMLTLSICSFRILAQFFFSAELFLLFITILFITILIYFTELFRVYKKIELFNDFRLVIGGFICGLGIQFFFFMADMSSNLSYDLFKLPFILVIIPLFAYLNRVLFKTMSLTTNNTKKGPINSEKNPNQLKLFHFCLLGMMSFIALSWILNPTVISAYDILNLSYNDLMGNDAINRISFAFTYYILIIFATAIIGFFVINYIFLKLGAKYIKFFVLTSNSVFCCVNLAAFLIVETNRSGVSTIILSLSAITGTFSLFLNLSYLFYFYSFPTQKNYLGLLIFVFVFVLLCVAEIIITWTFRLTLLLTLLIVSIAFVVFFLIAEFKKLKILIVEKNIKFPIFHLNKQIAALFLIIMCANLIPFVFVPLNRRIEQGSEENPTFLTYNTHNAIGIDDKFDMDRIVELIKEQDPDVVGLNEIDMGSLKTGYIDIASYIAQKLNMYYYYGPTFSKHYGNVVLSKYPFEDVENINLPQVKSNTEPRGVIRAEIAIGSKIWTVYITHLSTDHEDRLEQVDFIVDLITEEEDIKHTIWMGDLNFAPDSKEYSKLNATSDIKLRDTHRFLEKKPDLTCCFDEEGTPTNRIDYILCSPELIPVKCNVIYSIASDHCAVMTQF